MKQITKYLLIVICLTSLLIGGKAMSEDNRQPPVYFVIFHTPGPKWDKTKSFQRQPGVMNHVKYMSQFLESNELVIGGPFLDNSGGMMVLNAKDIEAAKKVAQEDPTVKSGLLIANVKPWLVAMSRKDL